MFIKKKIINKNLNNKKIRKLILVFVLLFVTSFITLLIIPKSLPINFYLKSYSYVYSILRPDAKPEATREYQLIKKMYRYYRPFEIIRRVKEGMLSNPEKLEIHVSFKNYQAINYRVYRIRESKQKQISAEDKNVKVKCKLIAGRKEYLAKIRLKGANTDHLLGDKWSFKITLRGKKRLWGMRTFSIHTPAARGYIFEWIYQQANRYIGIISLRYKFIRLSINGKDLGIYAIEEAFDKQLVENNDRREGVLIKPKNRILKLLKENSTKRKKPDLYNSYLLANKLWQKYYDGELAPEYMFDYEKTAKYFAMSEMFGGHHGHQNSNFLVYFNPVTTRFEPIPFDSDTSKFRPEINGLYIQKNGVYNIYQNQNQKFHNLFADIKFFKLYINYLKKFSKKEFLDVFLDSIKEKQKINQRILYSEFILIYLRYKTKRGWLKAYRLNIKKFLDNEINGDLNSYHKAFVATLDHYSNVKPNMHNDKWFNSYKSSNMNQFSFIQVDEPSKHVTIKKGNWILKKILVIPAGYTFIINPETVIDLRNNAIIVSYSHLNWKGVTIKSSDNTGSVYISSKDQLSVLRDVSFKGLRMPDYDGWKLTGAVTFYESKVKIINSKFFGNLESDDALNIIRSIVDISDSFFNNTYADAIDLDFCQGTISNTIFQNIGNDGVDLSGSQITGTDLKFENIGDKGLSIGESSDSSFANIDIKGAKVGVAIKDGSIGKINNINIKDVSIGLVVFRKKKEYQSANLIINKLKLENYKKEYLLEKRSLLFVDSKRYKPNSRNKAIKNFIY